MLNFQIVASNGNLLFVRIVIDGFIKLPFYRIIPDGGILRPPVNVYLVCKIIQLKVRQYLKSFLMKIKRYHQDQARIATVGFCLVTS